MFLTAFSTKSLRQHLSEQNLTEIYEKPIRDSQIYAILVKNQTEFCQKVTEM